VIVKERYCRWGLPLERICEPYADGCHRASLAYATSSNSLHSKSKAGGRVRDMRLYPTNSLEREGVTYANRQSQTSELRNSDTGIRSTASVRGSGLGELGGVLSPDVYAEEDVLGPYTVLLG